MIPSVSRIVHYVSYGTPGGEFSRACRAAVITETDFGPAEGNPVSLCVLSPSGMFFDQNVLQMDGVELQAGETRFGLCGNLDYVGGTWHWPARV